MFPLFSTRRGGGRLLSGGSFFGLGFVFEVAEAAEEVRAASRRELKVLMNSRALGESPRRFLRCSAAASLGRVVV